MRRISASTWAEIRTAYASGIGLREIARNMGIPAGTVLARSKRDEWTQQIAAAKLIQRLQLVRELAKSDSIGAITPMQSAAPRIINATELGHERNHHRAQQVVATGS